MSMQKLRDNIDAVKNVAQKDLRLMQKRQHDLEQLSTDATNLSKTSETFKLLAEENKWRMWWRNYVRSITIAIVFLSILITILLLFIVVIKVRV
jgi:hypothetical protein